ncbi:hypothetical protein CFP56_018014 [Quercus suber]|uniref:Uncharacterized protein n=1 Tax=Quercus suber TaxID=58331 RepID=A0AAW0KK69_QUESU
MKATGGRNRSPSRRTFDREDAGVEFAWRKDRSGKVSQEATGDGGVAVQNPREQDEKRKEGNCDKQGTVLEGAHVAPDITGCVEIFTEDMGSAVAAVQNSNKRDVVEVDDSMHVLPMDPGVVEEDGFTWFFPGVALRMMADKKDLARARGRQQETVLHVLASKPYAFIEQVNREC